uniref:ER membrane protein complex subunit 1 n=1 Tax=Acrobeloides nanus TaxID=290746 RepID=A0A914EHP0_9BILA
MHYMKIKWESLIGCPEQLFYKRVNGRDILLISSKQHALGSLDTANGNILWRQIQDSMEDSLGFTYDNIHDIVIVYNKNYIRAFDYSTGILKWENFISLSQNQRVGILKVIKNVVILTHGPFIYGIKVTSGSLLWSTDFKDNSEWIGVAENGESSINLVGGISNNKLSIVKLSLENGSTQNRNSIDVEYNFERCAASGRNAVCLNSQGTILAIDFSKDKAVPVKTVLEQPIHIYASLDEKYFVVKSLSSLHVLHVTSEKITNILKVEPTEVFSISTDSSTKEPIFMAYYDTLGVIKAFDLKSSKNLLTSKLVPERQAPISKLEFLSTGKTIEILTVRRDCRVDLHEARLDGKEVSIEWTRFEGLATIASVEMIDLPLSETQATIETEFTAKDAGILRTFILRVTSQVELFKRLFVQFAHRFVKSFELIVTNQASFSTIFRHLFGGETPKSSKPQRTGSVAKPDTLPMERDYFNLRKMIVVSTTSGSVYGLHNEDGSVIWSLYLGDDFEPLNDQLRRTKVPLFIQRGTSHYQFSSEAAVAFNVKNAKSSRLVIFNPITGTLVNTYQVERLKRVELLPFTNDEMLHPLMVLDINNKIDFFPSYSAPLPYSTFQFNFNASSGDLYGERIDSVTRKISTTWKNQLRFSKSEKIVAVASKPFSQTLHSQGKVLGDRAVLYKYSNPSLVALAAFDEVEALLTIYLIDAINGQIIYSGRHPRTRPPFHLVHCENWLAYSYWNEKARRTEIGVIELYEGLTQTNAVHFNSMTTEKTPLTIYAQSFIFSQGINAMTATETEQGLTNRNLLIALPFGGLLEVSKRFVDARRTIDLTPEMREEMIIPYMPELLLATEDLINYNQSIFNIRGIKTAPSGLESTSLVLAYGIDLFYTRVSPSGTFDILKDDFDYVLISLVMVVLIGGSFVVKRIWRQNSIEQAWS